MCVCNHNTMYVPSKCCVGVCECVADAAQALVLYPVEAEV